jgi:hypothetical protein
MKRADLPTPFTCRADRTIADADGIPLARCYAGRGEAAVGPLFAAAPDLLAALVELSDAVALRSLRGRDHVPSMRGEQEAVQGARYAISKARGEA